MLGVYRTSCRVLSTDAWLQTTPVETTTQQFSLPSVAVKPAPALLSRILKAEAILNRVDAIDDGLEHRQKRVLRGAATFVFRRRP